MNDELDELLAQALRTPPSAPVDTAAGLRRLATQAARRGSGAVPPPRWWRSQQTARSQLTALARSLISRPDAVGVMDKFAGLARLDDVKPTERRGARVYGCLLYLTGHPASAQFWWKFAGGADDLAAAYCLYLQHLQSGELREAELWFQEAARLDAATARPGMPRMPHFGDVLTIVAQDPALRDRPAVPLRETLGPEVDRLVGVSREENFGSAGIAAKPDRRFAEKLHELAGIC